MTIRYDKVTDDFQIIEGEQEEEEEEEEEQKKVLTELDYISLVLGARDYRYLIYENRNILDNEVTSLYPLCSYIMLMFILFMTSFKNPYMSYLFDFKKDREYGIFSKSFYNVISKMHKKWPLPYKKYTKLKGLTHSSSSTSNEEKKNYTYNLVSRPFTLLTMPSSFVITPYYLPGVRTTTTTTTTTTTLQQKNNKYAELMKDTHIIARRALKDNKFKNIKELEHIFKTDVLFYLPRFYYNYYTKKHEKSISIINYKRFAETDRKKQYLDISLSETSIGNIATNIKRLFDDLNIPVKNIPPIKQILRGNENRKGGMIDPTSTKELEEFYLKSILLLRRREEKQQLNTNQNRTNGVYLLHKGVSRFKELVIHEILHNPTTTINMNIVNITSRHITVHNKKTPLCEIVDFDNPPYLLSEKFMKVVDDTYGHSEIHSLIKYAQVYTRLFNLYGDNFIYFVLGTFLEKYTGFNYDKFIKRYSIIGKDRRMLKFTFSKFETLFYPRTSTTNWPIPNNKIFARFVKEMYENKIFTKEKRDYLIKKFCYNSPPREL